MSEEENKEDEPFGGFPRNQESPFAETIEAEEIPKANPTSLFSTAEPLSDEPKMSHEDAIKMFSEPRNSPESPSKSKKRIPLDPDKLEEIMAHIDTDDEG
jgi:hypothetical protein